MNVAGFIARKMVKSSETGRYSRPIIRIATLGVALGMTVMILSLAVVKGFQKEVRELVIGFGSHIQIVNVGDNLSGESEKVLINQEFYPSLEDLKGIKHIQVFASKAGILETPKHIQGIAVKGVFRDFDWTFFSERISRGRLLNLSDSLPDNGILISSIMANRMELDTGSKCTVYFIQGKEDISPRNMKVCGIYSTGLEEFDNQYVFCDLRVIQKVSAWGLQTHLLTDSCRDGKIRVEAIGFGGDGKHDFSWPETKWQGKGPHELCVKGDTLISCVVNDNSGTLPDTAWLEINSPATSLHCNCEEYDMRSFTSGGSGKYYAGGFEITIDSYKELAAIEEGIIYEIPFDMKTVSVTEQKPEIFSWLEVLDMNVVVIILMMVIVSVINMASAMLIIILERTSMIGALKAFGISDGQVVRIFLYHAVIILGRGMVGGNLLALIVAWSQLQFGWFTLDPMHYYVSVVPLLLQWTDIAILNAGVLITSMILLIIPALYVTGIAPARAVRFD